MNSRMKQSIFDLQAGKISSTLFLKDFPEFQTESFLLRTLDEIIDTQDGEKLEMLLLYFFLTEFPAFLQKRISQLLNANWHICHEDIALALQRNFKLDDSVGDLETAMETKFEYMEDDELREPFVTKCAYALADLGSEKGLQALNRLSSSKDPLVSAAAKFQLNRIGA